MPNKVALHCMGTDELLGLMAYAVDNRSLAVEIIYMESAGHSNANLLHETGGEKKYVGIAKALFAYAVSVSLESGYDGVLIFKANTISVSLVHVMPVRMTRSSWSSGRMRCRN